jgi:nucleotide-binding universal stress UspA family protein
MTTLFRRILHPTDFSPASRSALKKAIALAKTSRAHLDIVHVLPPVPLMPDAYLVATAYDDLQRAHRAVGRRHLDRLVARARDAGVRVGGVLVDFGITHERIVRVARRRRAGVIVMGTHGRTGLTRAVLGSVAARVIATAECPVLTVHAHARRPGDGRIRRVVHASDFSPASRAAFSEAVRIAKARRATLVVVHALSPLIPLLMGEGTYISAQTWNRLEESAISAARKRLHHLRERARRARVRATTLLIEGTPAEAIARAAKRQKADLLVLGTHGRSGLARFVIGSVAARVIATAPCAVLTVHAR